MDMPLTLKIVSPERIVFNGSVESVIVPGTQGQFEILPNHAPIISSLEVGEVIYNTDKKNTLKIQGGFISVQKNQINICVEI